jgi:hypothetical protein
MPEAGKSRFKKPIRLLRGKIFWKKAILFFIFTSARGEQN